jgi:hypothetical protein
MGFCFQQTGQTRTIPFAVLRREQCLPRPERGGGQVLFRRGPWPGLLERLWFVAPFLLRASPMIGFPCPKCNATLKAPEEKVGASTKCPHCGAAVQVQVPGPAPSPTAGAPASRSYLWPLAAVAVGAVVLSVTCCGAGIGVGAWWKGGGGEATIASGDDKTGGQKNVITGDFVLTEKAKKSASEVHHRVPELVIEMATRDKNGKYVAMVLADYAGFNLIPGGVTTKAHDWSGYVLLKTASNDTKLFHFAFRATSDYSAFFFLVEPPRLVEATPLQIHGLKDRGYLK